MEPCITGDMSTPLDGGPATTTMPTLRLTQQYQTMKTTSLLSPAFRSSLCSHEVSNRRVAADSGWFVSGWRWLFLETSQTSLSLAVLCHPSALSSKTFLKIMGCPWQIIDGMLALEVETYRRCFPAQLALSAFQGCNRRKSAFPLRDLAAAANLPPHRARQREQISTLTSTISTPRSRSLHSHQHSGRYPGLAPFQLPDPLQPARSLTDLLTAIAALLARRQPHSAPLLYSAWTVQQVITEE